MISIGLLRNSAIACALGLAGCATQTFAPNAAPEYLVTRNDSPFYELGPNQFAPPEERLDAGERVRMLRREFGYSRVLLPSGMAGYMANDDLAPAPSGLPAEVPEGSARGGVPVVDDAPLPDFDEAPPDEPAGL
jgi:hypothetical protein